MPLIDNDDRAMHEKSRKRMRPAPTYHKQAGADVYLLTFAEALANNVRETYRHGGLAKAELWLELPFDYSDEDLDEALRFYLNTVVGMPYDLDIKANTFGDTTTVTLIVAV